MFCQVVLLSQFAVFIVEILSVVIFIVLFYHVFTLAINRRFKTK